MKFAVLSYMSGRFQWKYHTATEVGNQSDYWRIRNGKWCKRSKLTTGEVVLLMYFWAHKFTQTLWHNCIELQLLMLTGMTSVTYSLNTESNGWSWAQIIKM